MNVNRAPSTPGSLVLSLDFEIHWGVRDKKSATSPYKANLLGVRQAIPQTLDLFEKNKISATWATVGFLFARSKQELNEFSPEKRPSYHDSQLDPYREPIGQDESDDPLHYAPSIVDKIIATPGQTLGTHTYSHFYCLEPGQTAEQFEADLLAAKRIANQRGIELTSIVFPRNQYNPNYDHVLSKVGIKCYRGNPDSWMYESKIGDEETVWRRAGRLVDSYLPRGPKRTMRWGSLRQPSQLYNVGASFFWRPYFHKAPQLERAKLARIIDSLWYAAKHSEILHLWWHPHNFGVQTAENIATLQILFDQFKKARARYGMVSQSMESCVEMAQASGL